MRVVSYTRTTTCVPFEDVPADIIKRQNDRIQDFCKKHGYKISHRYSDRKHDSDEEKEYRELLSDGMKHKFDLVVVDSLYRAGSYLGSAKEVLCKTLCFSGVNFAVVDDDFISIGKSNSEVISYIEGKYKEFYKLQKRQYALKRIRDGIFAKGEAKYGFDVIDGRLVINESEAKVVRRIFNECASGKGVGEIATGLNADSVMVPSIARGMKSVNKNGWSPSVIRNMIRKTVYKGDFERKYEEITVRCECPAIITAEVFEAAQKNIKTIENVGDYSRKSIFSGLVKDVDNSLNYAYEICCGVPSYRLCRDRAKKNSHIPYSDVYALVENLLNNINADALRIKRLIETEGEIELNRIREDISSRMREFAFRLAELEKEKMKYPYIPDDIYDEKSEIENEIRILEKDLDIMEKVISLKNPWLVRYLKLEPNLEVNKGNLKQVVKKIYFDSCVFDHFEFYEQNWYELLPEKWRV